MTLRILLFILLASYAFWFVARHILGKNITLLKVALYTLIIITFSGSILWFLSYFIEGH